MQNKQRTATCHLLRSLDPNKEAPPNFGVSPKDEAAPDDAGAPNTDPDRGRAGSMSVHVRVLRQSMISSFVL